MEIQFRDCLWILIVAVLAGFVIYLYLTHTLSTFVVNINMNTHSTWAQTP